MKRLIFSLIAIALGQAALTVALPLSGNYSILRSQILEYEQHMVLGANLSLNNLEKTANQILMDAKRKELAAAFANPAQFAPARNFLLAKRDIEQSEVFRLLRRMPKGAALHAHDTSLVSEEYVYHNVTFRDDLYVCDNHGVLQLRFFREPDEKCKWELLKDVRQDPRRAADVNERIKRRLSMVCNDPDTDYSNVDKAWDKFGRIFKFMADIVSYKPVYEDHFLRALEELYEDNVMYLEFRSTLPLPYDFEGTEYKERDVVGMYERLANRFKEEHPDFVGVKLIYSPQRFADHKTVEECMKIMKELQGLYPNFVAGFDLVGQEDKGNTLKYFADIMTDAGPDMNFFFHAGETNWYGASTDENLVDAILLNTRRIGHGYALTYHPFLLEMAKRMDIAIEINPISNQVLKLVDDLRNHAARRLFAEGYPLVVSNDDPGFWGARGLSYDFYEAFLALMSEHCSLKALKQLAMNSLLYSSMSNPEKRKALDVWGEKWDVFVKDVASEKY
ncbi:adenosine deaminase 2 [Andrena cerasifolii]|uniref:adenosine deaminase 2 n=1 Tax=Andrena cerasifolii TaxID=2819439 RepID=UPI00403760BE